MKNTLTRVLALLTALMLLLPAALAQDSSSLRADLNALRQREEAITIEMAIAELELQRASLMNDEAAAAAARAKQKALQDEMQTITRTKEDLALDMLEALEAEEDMLLSAHAAIDNDLIACDAALEQLDEKYGYYLLELFNLGTFAPLMAQPEKRTLSELEAEYEALLAEEQVNEIDLQINDLRLQQAQAQQNQAAFDEAAAARTALLDTQQSLTDRKCTLISALLDAIKDEENAATARREALLAEAATLETALASLNEDFAWVAEAAANANPCPTIADLSYQASAMGLMSEVTVFVTLNADGSIADIAVDCSGETPVIAGPCAEEPFLSQFVGRVGPFTDIDVVSGATFTSKAVINAVNSLFPAGEVLTASAKGLLSDVTVFVTLNADGSIADISVDCSGETQFLAGPCAEEPFLSQFVGRTGPFTDIDVVSGATFTSKAVIDAVNSLFPAGEVLTASAKGLLSDVTVFVTLNADGSIATINVDCSGETQFLAGPCAEEPFLSQFVGRTSPFNDIDVVSGATYTSKAVINAVNSLFGGN